MRLVVRSLIAGLALASGATLAGCPGVTGLADAQGATHPVSALSTSLGRAVTATAPAASATKTAAPGPVLDVVDMRLGVKAKEIILVDATTGQAPGPRTRACRGRSPRPRRRWRRR